MWTQTHRHQKLKPRFLATIALVLSAAGCRQEYTALFVGHEKDLRRDCKNVGECRVLHGRVLITFFGLPFGGADEDTSMDVKVEHVLQGKSDADELHLSHMVQHYPIIMLDLTPGTKYLIGFQDKVFGRYSGLEVMAVDTRPHHDRNTAVLGLSSNP